MKSLRSSLILLVVVLAFGAYIYFNERGPIADSDSVVLMRSDPKQIGAFELTSTGKTISFSKKGKRWVMRNSPFSPLVSADPDAVQSLLDELPLLQSPKVFEKAEPEFGLDKPKLRLKLASTRIEFGNSPVYDSSKVYALVDTGYKKQIGLLNSSLLANGNKPFDEWRDKAALRVTLDEVEKFSIKAPAISATFEKTKTGEDGAPSEWRITAPVQAQAESSIIESLIGQLPVTKVTRFLDDSPKQDNWGVGAPLARIEIATPHGPLSLSLGKKTSGGYAAKNSASGGVAEVPDSLFAMLNRPLRDWRDKSVLKIEPDQAKNVSLTARGQTKTFAKRGDKWRENGHEPGNDAKEQEAADAAHRAVIDLLLNIQSLNATDFVDKPGAPAAYGLDKPLLSVNVDNQWLNVGDKGGKIYARLGDEGTVFVLPSSAKASLQTPLDKLFALAKK